MGWGRGNAGEQEKKVVNACLRPLLCPRSLLNALGTTPCSTSSRAGGSRRYRAATATEQDAISGRTGPTLAFGYHSCRAGQIQITVFNLVPGAAGSRSVSVARLSPSDPWGVGGGGAAASALRHGAHSTSFLHHRTTPIASEGANSQFEVARSCAPRASLQFLPGLGRRPNQPGQPVGQPVGPVGAEGARAAGHVQPSRRRRRRRRRRRCRQAGCQGPGSKAVCRSTGSCRSNPQRQAGGQAAC